MATVDIELATWALDEARRKGASAAEVLCVTAESLSAGVRHGRSRETQEFPRAAAGSARILRTVFRDLVDGRTGARFARRLHREHGRACALVGGRSVGGIARPFDASEVIARAFTGGSRQRNSDRGSRAGDRAQRRERGAEIRSAHEEFRGRRIQLRARPDSVRQQPGFFRRVFRHLVHACGAADRARRRRDAAGILVHLEPPFRKARRCGVGRNNRLPGGRSAGSERARSGRCARRSSSIPTWLPD